MITIHNFKDYKIDEYGNIYSNKTNKFLSQNNKNSHGYKRCMLSNKNESKYFLISRLVAEHFVKNPNKEKYREVNHIDGNIENNYYKNLEWTNKSGNAKHRYDVLLKKQFNLRKLSNVDIVNIRKSNLSQRKLANKYKLSQASIFNIIHKKTYSEVV